MEEIKTALLPFIVNPYVQAILVVLLSWLVAKIFIPVVTAVLTKMAAKTKTELDDRLIKVAKKPLTYLIILVGAYVAIASLPGRDNLWIKISLGLIYVLGVVFAFSLLNGVMVAFLKWYGQEIATRTQSTLDDDFLPLINKVGKIFLACSAIVIVMRHFNYDITSIIVSLGIGSLAIGLAAKDTLENMISGFLIMIDRPFRIADRVQLSGGELGDIVDIGIRSTKIKDLNNSIIVVPNRELVSSKLINHCYPDNQVKVRIPIGVAYGTDVNKVKEILLNIAKNEELVLDDPAPSVYFLEFADSSLNFLLIVWIRDFRKGFSTKDAINTEIDRIFKEENIDIPFPQRVIHTKS